MVGRFFHSEETAVRFCPCPLHLLAPFIVVDVVDHSTIIAQHHSMAMEGIEEFQLA